MENYSDFCTSFCVSFANLYFIGTLSFYLYFKIRILRRMIPGIQSFRSSPFLSDCFPKGLYLFAPEPAMLRIPVLWHQHKY